MKSPLAAWRDKKKPKRFLFKFVSVLLSASVERVGVSRMQDFFFCETVIVIVIVIVSIVTVGIVTVVIVTKVILTVVIVTVIIVIVIIVTVALV